jgi:hypothetical protein
VNYESYPLAKTVDGFIIDLRFKNSPTKNVEIFLGLVAKKSRIAKYRITNK